MLELQPKLLNLLPNSGAVVEFLQDVVEVIEEPVEDSEDEPVEYFEPSEDSYQPGEGAENTASEEEVAEEPAAVVPEAIQELLERVEAAEEAGAPEEAVA